MKIWTDGCCLKNPGGAGAWAFVVEHDGKAVYEGVGSNPSTTNNVMEMKAVIWAIRWWGGFLVREPVEIISDSKYVVTGITEWVPGWKQRGWQRKTKDGLEPVKNLRLWQTLDALVVPELTFRWVKGHAELPHNERADQLASAAARRAA